mmetsp:Transcript_75040/g.87129  ORF Transcript_75040/g.87129 Transcript_75040/m.87129 type:complete len:117 (+) Transcript_75040:327-677(+)
MLRWLVLSMALLRHLRRPRRKKKRSNETNVSLKDSNVSHCTLPVDIFFSILLLVAFFMTCVKREIHILSSSLPTSCLVVGMGSLCTKALFQNCRGTETASILSFALNNKPAKKKIK